MKKTLTILILGLTISCFSQSPEIQSELSNEAQKTYLETDSELNNIYRKIITEYKTDSIFIDKLKIAQRLWIKYRDAELEMKYPSTDKNDYGKAYSMCVSIYLKELTEQRIEKLKVWIDGIDEGDICIGSVKKN